MDYVANVYSELFVAKILPVLFDSNIAYLDAESVKLNLALATPSGWSEEDRSIRAGLVNYLLNNFGYIRYVLIQDSDLRKLFVDCVKSEIELDLQDDNEYIAFVRAKDMDVDDHSNEKMFVIDLSSYNSKIANKIVEKVKSALMSVENLDYFIDYYTNELTEEDRVDIGFCVSNFMYLIRAFANNVRLSQAVKSVVRDVRESVVPPCNDPYIPDYVFSQDEADAMAIDYMAHLEEDC